MRQPAISSIALLMGLAFSGAAGAADPEHSVSADARIEEAHRWYANVGISGIFYDSSSELSIMSARVADADAELSDAITASVEFGYHLNPNLSLALTLGLPPKSSLDGRGSFEGVELGNVTYGPIVATAKYHVTAFGDSFRPYVGAGAAYTVIFSDTDSALKNFNVDGEFGAVLQGGVELDVADDQHVFIDVKKIFLDASGTATTFHPVSGAPLPATAKVELDPLVITAGIGFRF